MTMEIIVREVYDLQIREREFGCGIGYGTMKFVWSQNKNP